MGVSEQLNSHARSCNAIRLLSAGVLIAVLSAHPAPAQDDEDDEDFLAATPGLIAAFESDGHTVRRVDPDVAATWTGSPDQRLRPGLFKARWSSNLLTQRSGDYRFYAFVSGSVEVDVAGKTVLKGRGQSEWVDGAELSIPFGDHSINVRYESNSDGHGTLRLFWSSDDFPIEPIPARLFSFEQEERELAATAIASNLHSAYRCARCHVGSSFDATDGGPSLSAIREGLSPEWFTRKLTARPQPGDSSKMPHFDFDASQVADITAFVFSKSRKPKTKKPSQSKAKDADLEAGHKLVRTLGCLACHEMDGLGTAGAYSGGSLSDVRQKRSVAWVHTWLSDPKSLNADHRMPVFSLSKDERRQLALALGGEPIKPPKKGTKEQIARGKALVVAARCANCHRIPGLEPDQSTEFGVSSCLAPAANHRGPRYPQISKEIAASIVEWQRSVVSTLSPYHAGSRLLERRNCIACHERDSTPGILPVVGELINKDRTLRTDSQGLIPPALTAVGDKLKDDALSRSIAGRQKKVRLPWLSVRMPKFEHSKSESEALRSFLIEHDRIPERDAPPGKAGTSSQTLVAGQQLIGPTGFSCIACHVAGSYAPRNVALGTRGSDLLMPGERMRKEYFLRWTRSPIRIVPGMEMPSITRPVKGVFNNDIHQQLAAAWDALNDKDFTVPTNPASFEQFVQVKPGQPARVIRDVFTDPVSDGYIARPLVVGLNNGHNVMFDLDQFGFRHWWFGDTARQRTEGKSWYWDVAGIGIGSQTVGSDVVLRGPDGSIVRPVVERATSGRLESWSHIGGGGVLFSYKLNFLIDGVTRALRVTERVQPYAFVDKLRGWRRTLLVRDVPRGHERLCRLMETPDETEIVVDSSNVVKIDGQSYLGFERDVAEVGFLSPLLRPETKAVVKQAGVSPSEKITSVPGFDGVRLPLPGSIMPTAIAWRSDGTLVFTSLKGHVFLARDSDADGLPDTMKEFEEGLAAPFGVLRDGDDLLVAHKPEVIRLRDRDGDDRADERTVVSTGWGYSDNYHDWTCGLVRDSKGDIYFGLGSDYSQKARPKNRSLWRGAVLRLNRDGTTEPVSWSFRYPVGFAIDKQDRVFVTDNQGVQNTFNEINHIEMGRHYGVPSRHEPNADEPETTPAIRVPHPWVRSMNGIVFLPEDHASPFGGHLIGCEYDTHLLVRMSFQTVDGVVQGASYYLSKPGQEGGGPNFVGPICGAVAKNGDIYVGSIHDSGWLGGRNTGAIERIRFHGKLPNGIRELRATPDGFEVDFIREVSPDMLESKDAYSISAYTRSWKGSYATPDSGRHEVPVSKVEVLNGGSRVRLVLAEKLRREYVYEISVGGDTKDLFPATGHYTMKRIPAR